MLRSQHVEATRRALLDAARSAFGKKGYAQASVDEIAAAAGVRATGAADPTASPIEQLARQLNAYDQFPPDALRKAVELSRRFPPLARTLVRLQLPTSIGRRRGIATVTANGLDPACTESFFGPIRRDNRAGRPLSGFGDGVGGVSRRFTPREPL
jgi:hypothetical protein